MHQWSPKRARLGFQEEFGRTKMSALRFDGAGEPFWAIEVSWPFGIAGFSIDSPEGNQKTGGSND
jgi:hypothetical protein